MTDVAPDADDADETVTVDPFAEPTDPDVDQEAPVALAPDHDPDVKLPADVQDVDPSDEVVEPPLDSVADLTQDQHSGPTVEHFNADGSRRDISTVRQEQVAAEANLA